MYIVHIKLLLFVPTKKRFVGFWLGCIAQFSDMAENADVPPRGPYFRKERVRCSPEEEARLEREHFWRIIDAFKFYRYLHTITAKYYFL